MININNHDHFVILLGVSGSRITSNIRSRIYEEPNYIMRSPNILKVLIFIVKS